jgi:hypothetical protein
LIARLTPKKIERVQEPCEKENSVENGAKGEVSPQERLESTIKLEDIVIEFSQ